MKTEPWMRTAGALALTLSLAALTSRSLHAQAALPHFTIADLGPLPGGTTSFANDLTNSRLVVGESTVADGMENAVLWAGPIKLDLGPHGLNSLAFGINERVQASMLAEISSKDPHNENFCAWGTGLECRPFLWQGGVPTQLPLLGGNNGTVSNINNRGEIAGIAETSTMDPECTTGVTVSGTGPQVLDFEAVIWGPTPGSVRTLRPLPGDTVGLGMWINDSGQVVGASGTCANTILPGLAYGPHAVLWDSDGSVHDLGNLGSTTVNIALAINNQGEVVGAANNASGTSPFSSHAFLWTKQTGKMQDLGTLPGDFGSAGLGIGDGGDVVGLSNDQYGNSRAYLWRNDVMHDLNDLVPANSSLFLLAAYTINSSGVIVGIGATAKGDVHGFLAIPASGIHGNAEAGISQVREGEDTLWGLPADFRAAALAAYRVNQKAGQNAAGWRRAAIR